MQQKKINIPNIIKVAGTMIMYCVKSTLWKRVSTKIVINITALCISGTPLP